MDRRIFIYSVIASLVATLAFYALLEPLSKLVWNYATDSAQTFLIELQNAAFRNAAIGKRDWVGPLLFFQFAGGWIAIWVGLLIGLWLRFLFPRANVTMMLPSRPLRRRRLVLILLLLFSCWTAGLTYSWLRTSFLVYVDLQLNASFDQRVAAISPYIDSTEEERLRSSWALMNPRADYEAINSRLDELGQRAGITLPAPLYR